MITADVFVKAARDRGFGLWSGVPCSYLKPFINFVIDSPEDRYIAAANEGDAVAIASGAALAGVRGNAMFQNSGLGNAVNPLTSLNYIFKIPILLITTLRGEPGGPHDEPQHGLMGPITTRMLEVMEIPWEYFPTREEEVAAALDRAVRHMDETGIPFAFVMKKDSVAPWPVKSRPEPRPVFDPPPREGRFLPAAATRTEMLKALRAVVRQGDIVLATTGFTGRELYALEDSENQLYMVGSMGCLMSLALGVALVRPDRRVIAVDGDGAVLMRMGGLSTVGYERPKNLVHIVLDNGTYESTGDQATVSPSVDLPAVAAACGYPRVVSVSSPEDLAAAVAQRRNDGLTFIHAPIKSGVPDKIGRASCRERV